MACGGDDSALTVHKITATSQGDLLQSERVTEIATAHAAQITGTLHNRKSNNTRLGMSTGIQYTIYNTKYQYRKGKIIVLKKLSIVSYRLIFEINIK